MIKLACQERLIPGDGLVEKWQVASDAGFDGIELLGHGAFRLRERLPELRAARAAGAVFSTVCVAMDHFIGDFDAHRRRDAIENLQSQLSVIAELGGAGAITPAAYGMFTLKLPPFDRPPRTPEEDREVLIDALRELGEHAAREGVAVFFEPLNRYEDHMVNRLEQGAEICRAVGLHSVRLLADTYHMNIEEDRPPDALRTTGALLGHVHVADNTRLQPGMGHIDFAAVTAALREIGFHGWLAMECTLRGDPRLALRRAADVLRAVL